MVPPIQKATHRGMRAVRAPPRIGPRGQVQADRAEREGQRWPGGESAGQDRIVSGTSSPGPTESGAPPIAAGRTIIGPAAPPGRWGDLIRGQQCDDPRGGHAGDEAADTVPWPARASRLPGSVLDTAALTGVHRAVLAAPVVLSRGALYWHEPAPCREPLCSRWLISTPSSAAPTSAANTRAAVIRRPGREQIGATVTGLGSRATLTGTVNVPGHARAC
jgi:hypothetical protein